MSNIIEIAYLVEFLARENNPQSKSNAIKLAIQNGEITQEEGLDLIIEYT